MKNICRLIELHGEVKVVHSYREANKCVDALANVGCSLELNSIFLDVAPDQIRILLYEEFYGNDHT